MAAAKKTASKKPTYKLVLSKDEAIGLKALLHAGLSDPTCASPLRARQIWHALEAAGVPDRREVRA